MDWLAMLGLGIILLMVVLIGLLLSSLAKQGDERKQLIKAKTMSQTFAVVIGLLLFKSGQSVYMEIWKGQEAEGMNPFSFLVTISILYLITLQFNKKKHGT
jgi:hypothetical protein